MQVYIENYCDFFNIGMDDKPLCEVCKSAFGVDFHHVIPRSHFGKKCKNERDEVRNVMLLCRTCHEKAHDHIIPNYELQRVHDIHIKMHEK
jgi:5-methylcytosine-specific restriction endonuclease McrA